MAIQPPSRAPIGSAIRNLQQQESGLDLVLAENALAEQLHVDERHHQGRAGDQGGAQRREERSEVHACRFDQPGFCEPLPNEERHGREQRADEQQWAVARQHLLAVRGGVVQAKGRQPEGEREKQTADDVHLLGILGLRLRQAG